MKTRTLGLVALLAIGALTLTGCNKTETPVENLDENTEIANPAAVYCEENNGTLNLEEGLCMFDDGSYCEEWAYFREECQPGEINTNSEDEIDSEEVIEEENETTEVSDEEVVNDNENTDETIEEVEADAEM